MVERAFTNEQKLDCLRRELAYRRRVYPRQIEQGKMSKQFAEAQYALMEAIIKDYEPGSAREKLL